jgi:hypothetical protein
VASALSAGILLIAAFVVLGRGGYWSGSPALFRWGTWALVGLLAFSALGNFASPSRWETFLLGPVAPSVSLLCLIVALITVGIAVERDELADEPRAAGGCCDHRKNPPTLCERRPHGSRARIWRTGGVRRRAGRHSLSLPHGHKARDVAAGCEVVIDQLSLPWEDVVTAVEQRSGRPAIRTSDR